MPHHSRIARALAFAVLCAACLAPPAAAEDFSFDHENVMGTSLELLVRADTRAVAAAAEASVLNEIDRLAAIFSGYDRASEFSRWQLTRHEPIPVSPELLEVLRLCDTWRANSRGAFDPRVEVFTRLWSAGAAAGRRPTGAALAAAGKLLFAAPWRLDPAAHTAERLSHCPLSVNGIAKGYIVERACDLAFEKTSGVRGILLNVGGDLRIRGELPRTIGIAAPWADSESSEPLAYVTARDRSIATSGSSQRGFRIDGVWYSHVIDPRNGLPVAHVKSATVVAPRGADADALAKVCNVLEPAASLRLVNGLPDVECLIVTHDGRVARSDGWHRLERPNPAAVAAALEAPIAPDAAPTAAPAEPKSDGGAAASPPWNPAFELAVSFEINRPASERGRYRRPFVAVWIEDNKGTPVRTLLLWVSLGGSGPFQWLPDLKRWYSRDEERKRTERKDIFFTIARPTREPGQYKAIWDGRDNNGKQLAGGEYTVYIEAAREHGTYQSIHRQVSLSDKPFSEDLKGNVEIKSASIEYRRKAQTK